MKRNRNYPLILGICLIFLGTATLLGLGLQAKQAAREARAVYNQINSQLPPRSAGITGLFSDPAMPVLELEGTDFCGLLEIPAYGVRLPIADQWKASATRRYPCRFQGSVYDNTLVIGGTDQEGQLTFCDRIDVGEKICMIDLTGMEFTFQVTRVDRSKSAASGWLTDSGAALTIFVRDATSLEYIALRCDFEG